MIKSYYKKPAKEGAPKINAVRWDGTDETYEFLRGWTVNNVQRDSDGCLLVQEAGCVTLAHPGDYVRNLEVAPGKYTFRRVKQQVFDKWFVEAEV